MLKTDFCQPMTLDNLMALHDKYGLVVEINNGEVTAVDFE